MSYLQLPDGIPNFRQAVISLWFRVPQTSMDVARAAYGNAPYPPPPFTGIVPLLTFGKPTSNRRYTGEQITFATFNHRAQNWMPNVAGFQLCGWTDNEPGYPRTTALHIFDYRFTGAAYEVEPCYIGVDCRTERNVLAVTLQMENFGTIANDSSMSPTSVSAPERLDWIQPLHWGICTNNDELDLDENGFVNPVREWTTTYSGWQSIANITMQGAPECFCTAMAADRINMSDAHVENAGQEIVPDKWHHLLLSFDLTASCNTFGQSIPGFNPGGLGPGSVESAPRMWIALDDKNLTEKALSYYWPAGSSDPNAILTPCGQAIYWNIVQQGVWNNAPPVNDLKGNMTATVYDFDNTAVPSYTYTPGPVPSSGAHIGIPAAAEYVDAIQPVEMAELQFFTNVTMDTAIESKRRAFIDKDGKPVPPSEAETLLGKKPEITLHGTGNWIKGDNTGGIPGDLLPIGKIVSYSPDPSLHGPQGT